MPEAQAAPAATPAPAANASPVETPAPAAASGAESEPAKKPEPKKTGKARHDEIRAKLTEAKKAAAAPEPAKTEPAKPDAAKKPEAEAEPKKPAVGAVMRLTAENTKLTNELAELRSKLEASGKEETLSALKAKVKADPAVLFDLFGEDIDADENGRWNKLVDAVRDRQDPVAAEQRRADRERDERVRKLEDELKAEREGKATLTQREHAERARAHTSKTLTEGAKGDDGSLQVDPAKYPWINHLTKVGEVDVHRGVAAAVSGMVDDFAKAKGRDPSDSEVNAMIAIAAGKAEEHFSKRAKNWQLAQAAAPAPAPAAEPTRPTTIGSNLGSRAAGGVDTKHLSKRERHEMIRERLRQANRQAAPN